VEHHPHRNKAPTIFPLDTSQFSSSSSAEDASTNDNPVAALLSSRKESINIEVSLQPHAPWPSRPDFEISADVVEALCTDIQIDRWLGALTKRKEKDLDASPTYQGPYDWIDAPTKVTLQSAKEFHKYMDLGTKHILAVRFIL
jgi:hypothetical protein